MKETPCTSPLFQRHLAHLIAMAKAPGWKAYAWQRAKELDADRSGLWTGIASALVTALERERTTAAAGPGQTSACDPQTPEKRP